MAFYEKRRDPASMKITPAKTRLLLAMLTAEPHGQEAVDRAGFKSDPNGVCYGSLAQYGMVKSPGVLTDAGRRLAIEIRDAELAPARPVPDF